MARNGKVGPEERKQMIADYRAGVPLSKIAQRFGVAECTVSYHVSKAGIQKRTKNYRNTASMCVLRDRPKRKCLKCGRMFRPYTFNLCLFRNICWQCWTLASEHESTPENPIGRRI